MKKLVPILLLFLILITGCNNNGQAIDENKLNIVTSFYPIYIATANIVDGIEDVELTNLASPTIGCLHDYQLTTKDMVTLETADVFIINGAGMEAFLDKVVTNYNNLNIINASEGIETIKNAENAETALNAHVWVSITNHIKQVENIRDKMIELDQKNADKYMQNAEDYINRLNDLKVEMHNGLDNLESKDIVTFHEAFNYFANEFGLNIIAVIESEPGVEPSAGELAIIIEKIRNSNAKAIFVEPQYSKTSSDVIARELGIKIYTLDPVVTGDLNKNSYIDIMRSNLENLIKALK
jgi:zinc transport system substrate-binding protein